jgi:hypothetical protein
MTHALPESRLQVAGEHLHLGMSERKRCVVQADDVRANAPVRSSIDLYWLPLGAGGHSVRLNGHLYEALAARLGRRPACVTTRPSRCGCLKGDS